MYILEVSRHRYVITSDHHDYTGTWNLSMKGIPCQRWDSQTPNSHSNTDRSHVLPWAQCFWRRYRIGKVSFGVI